jgi:hypothetical protein
VPKCESLKSSPLHVQELNYNEGVYDLEDHDGEEALSSNLLPKLEPTKKTLTSFLSHLLENI